jgi:biopolymer transport protein ExbD
VQGVVEEGSKIPVIIGVVLGAICVLGCLGASVFLFLFAPAKTTSVAVSTRAVALPPVMLAVLPDGGMLLDGAPVDDLGDALDDKRRSGQNSLTIAADPAVPYTFVVKIIDTAKQAGIENIALGVSAEEGPGGRDAG